jgi:hypothetical protein
MTITFVVLDTSYLLELLKVPSFWDEDDHREIHKRIESATQTAGVTLLVAPGVVFEVADHIADVRHGAERKRIASQWRDLVVAGLEGSSSLLFAVFQSDESNGLNSFVAEWCDVITNARPQAKDKGDIGLTDWGTIVVAQILKKRHSKAKIHVWTKDRRLKRHEPDKEDDPYCGK